MTRHARGLLMLLSVSLILGCSSVENGIARQVAKGPGADVVIAEATPFAWDRLYVFGPYTPPDSINKELGIKWTGAAESGMELDDGHSLLVFVERRKVVASLMYPRGRGDFAEVARSGGYTRREAGFTIRERRDSWPELKLAK